MFEKTNGKTTRISRVAHVELIYFVLSVAYVWAVMATIFKTYLGVIAG